MPQGWLAYATSSQGSFHDTTEMYTPKISRTGPQCTLKFFYYMDGPSVDSLIVFDEVNGVRTRLWEKTGGSLQLWQAAEIFIGPRANAVIIIQSRRGNNFQGGIAIDDLQFIDCQPPEALPQACRADQFTCQNQYCIDPKLQCNYADDCGDNSDEVVGLTWFKIAQIYLL